MSNRARVGGSTRPGFFFLEPGPDRPGVKIFFRARPGPGSQKFSKTRPGPARRIPFFFFTNFLKNLLEFLKKFFEMDTLKIFKKIFRPGRARLYFQPGPDFQSPARVNFLKPGFAFSRPGRAGPGLTFLIPSNLFLIKNDQK